MFVGAFKAQRILQPRASYLERQCLAVVESMRVCREMAELRDLFALLADFTRRDLLERGVIYVGERVVGAC
jgi:hypothetical protein